MMSGDYTLYIALIHERTILGDFPAKCEAPHANLKHGYLINIVQDVISSKNN